MQEVEEVEHTRPGEGEVGRQEAEGVLGHLGAVEEHHRTVVEKS